MSVKAKFWVIFSAGHVPWGQTGEGIAWTRSDSYCCTRASRLWLHAMCVSATTSIRLLLEIDVIQRLVSA